MTRDPDPVLYACENGLATITLDRPARRNALTAPMLASLGRRLAEAAADPEARAIVLTGSGRAFCAGQDLNDRDPRVVAWPPDLEAIQRDLFHPVITAMRGSEKPILAVVNGVAAGAGVGLALAADIVIAAQGAPFVLSFSKIGLSADAGVGRLLVEALGAPRARALLLTGATLSAAEAVASGLIFRATPDDDLAREAAAIARALADGPTFAYRLIRRAVDAAAGSAGFEDYLAEEARLQGAAGSSEDYREGVLAFLEKRAPQFRGR